MRVNAVKERLLAGEVVYGYALGLGSAIAAEGLSRTGVDFLLIDMQHGSWDMSQVGAALMAMTAGTVPMARPAFNDYTRIGKLLDEGAMGIVVPMVDTPGQAKAAADACLFPPEGTRSHGYSGALRLADDDPVAYVREMNDQLFLAVQFESVTSIDNAEAILATPGVDGCWVGPADLAMSLGLAPSTAWEQPAFQEALQRVLAACEATGTVPGYAAFTPSMAEKARALGFRFLTAGWDIGFMVEGAVEGVRRLRA